ncbi:MAG: hypothetical protein M1827_003220 [Pycnora praestabilis]|nr:MAG: hypothetical protein M1827_003220 [Pycnora praestabilis]
MSFSQHASTHPPGTPIYNSALFQSQLPTYNPNTPPPPPPKPTISHENSRISTPQGGPPLPPPPPLSTANDSSHRPADSQQQQGQPQQYPPQDPQQRSNEPEHGWLPETVKDKSTLDLSALLQSPALLTALTNGSETAHPSLETAIAPLHTSLSANLNLAHSILALEQTVIAQRASTQSHLLTLHALEHQWRTTQTRMDSALAPFSPKALYTRLGQSIAEQEAVCEALEESFMEGEGKWGEREVGDFVKRYREGRKVVFLRRERKARWDEGRVGGWR